LIILFYGFGWQRILQLPSREAFLYGIAASVAGILFAIWVYIDAKRRLMRALVWALFTFFLIPAGLVLYLLETQSEPPVSDVEVNN